MDVPAKQHIEKVSNKEAGKGAKSNKQNDTFALVRSLKGPDFKFSVLVEKGFPLTFVETLREEGFTPGEVHSLIVPARTLKHRRAKKQDLSPEETDRAVRLTKIATLADRVFGNHDKALRWLRRRNQRLDGRAPLEMLRTEVGGDLVEQMLYQIDEGIYV